MTLSRATIDAILADIAAAKTGALHNPPNVIGHNEASEDADVEAAISKGGGTILDVEAVHGVGTLMGGEVRRIHYRAPNGDERWAYAIPHRFEIDAFGEESLICSAPAYDDPSDLANAVRSARAARQDESDALLDRLTAIDAKWASVWPAGLPWTPRALPWLVKDNTYISYARQVRDDGPEAILTWPDKTLLEIHAKQDIRAAAAKGVAIGDTEPARMMAALIQIYSAAGILS
jgi:hypothetical protein